MGFAVVEVHRKMVEDAARTYDVEMAWSDEDEVFIARFPEAPGVMTHGATRAEAAEQADDAIITWLTAHDDAGIPIPNAKVGGE